MKKEEFKKLDLYKKISDCTTVSRLKLLEHSDFCKFLKENGIKKETRKYGTDIKSNELAFSTMVNMNSPVMETVLIFP